MKKIIVLLCSVAVLLTACGGGNEKQEDWTTITDVEALKQVVKQQKADIKLLNKELKSMEAKLYSMDPSLKREKRIPVTLAKVERKDFQKYIEIQGAVMPANDPAFASSETGGRVRSLKVKEGDYVEKGQLIAEVDLESLQRSIDELAKSMELAEDIYKRQENLWKKNIGSEVQYLQAKNQVESLQKTKERLEFELTKASVYAPANGYIEMVMIKTGEMCGPGSPIVQILNTKSLKAVVNVPEIYLPNIKKGNTVSLSFPALRGETQEARVSMIGRAINPINRTFEVEATIKSKNGLIKPNLLAVMLLKNEEQKDVVVISDELILQDVSGASYVMIKKGEKAVKQIINLGTSYANETVVLSGLTGTEELIVKGAQQVADGDLLTVIKDEATIGNQG